MFAVHDSNSEDWEKLTISMPIFWKNPIDGFLNLVVFSQSNYSTLRWNRTLVFLMAKKNMGLVNVRYHGHPHDFCQKKVSKRKGSLSLSLSLLSPLSSPLALRPHLFI